MSAHCIEKIVIKSFPLSSEDKENDFIKENNKINEAGQETATPVLPDFQFRNIPLYTGSSFAIQSKLSINIQGDQYEQEAEAMADKVMRISEPNANAAMVVSTKPLDTESMERKDDYEDEEKKEKKPASLKKIQRKFSAGDDEPEKRKDKKIKGSKVSTANAERVLNAEGKPMDKITRSFMERRFGFDFGKVKIHDDPQSHRSARDINALAYTYKNNIVFGAGQYQPHTVSGKRLLAHELTHVLQQRVMKPFIQRKTNPEELEGFSRLPESIYVLAKNDFFFVEAPDQPVTSPSALIIKDQRLELLWKKDDWYYGISETGQEGYVKAANLVFPPVTDLRKAQAEEFATFIGGTLFIQAKNMHNAFVMAKAAGLIPNVGMIFWYSNGKKKPYPVDYYITTPEPTEAELEAMRRAGGLSKLSIVGGSLGSQGAVQTAIAQRKLNAKEQRFKDAQKELLPYIEKYKRLKSDTQPGRYAFQVKDESKQKLWTIFDEFAVKKGLTKSNAQDSDYIYYFSVFSVSIENSIKNDFSEYGLGLRDHADIVGTTKWMHKTQLDLLELKKSDLEKRLETIIKEEQDKRKDRIDAFFKPYRDSFKTEIEKFIAENIKRIGEIKDTVKQDFERKKLKIIVDQRRDEWMNKAQKEFESSSLAKELREAVEKRYTEEQKKIFDPNPYELLAVQTDQTLRGMLSYYDRELPAQKTAYDKSIKLQKAQEFFYTYLSKEHEQEAPFLHKTIMLYLTKKLMINDKGNLSVFAIKTWAAVYYEDLQTGIKNIDVAIKTGIKKDLPHLTDDQINRGPSLMDSMVPDDLLFSFATSAYLQMGIEVKYAMQGFKKIMDHPENDEGFWDGFMSKELHEFIPFIHTLIDIQALKKQLMTVNRVRILGTDLSFTEELMLQAYAGLQYINQIQKKPFWYRVGEGVAESIPFIGEFIITAPIGGVTGSMTTKIAEKALLRIGFKEMEKAIVKVTFKLLTKATGIAVGSFFQTLANPLAIQKNILELGTDGVNLIMNEDGSLTVEITEKNESKAAVIWKGFALAYVDVFTERLGGKVLPFIGGKVAGKFGKFIPMAARNSVFSAYMKRTSEILKKYAGFHGILGEYEEEVYGQILESFITGKQLKWSWEDQAQTFMVVAIIGAPVKGIQSVFAAYQIMRTLRYQGKDVVLPASIYTALTQLTSESAMAQFEALLESEKLSEPQKELARYLAGKTLNIEHEINLSQNELTKLQGKDPALPQTIKQLSGLIIALYKARKNLVIDIQSGKKVAPQSVLLTGEEGATIPLILYDLPQTDKWIRETEAAIAALEGTSLSELQSAGAAGVGMESNISFWTRFSQGWRPYIEQAKLLSPGSVITLTPEGLISINGNVMITKKMLVRMLAMDKTNLLRLLSASETASMKLDAGKPVPMMNSEDFQKLMKANATSSVSTGPSWLININDQVQVSPAVLQGLKAEAPGAEEGKKKDDKKKEESFAEFDFLFSHSRLVNINPADINKFTPEDQIAIRGMVPGSQIVDNGNGYTTINNQIEVSNTFLKELMLKDPASLKQLLLLTMSLDKNGKDLKKLTDEEWKLFKDFTKSGGFRLRFKVQYETELQQFITNAGLDKDFRFTALFAKAGLEEKMRLWDLYNEVGYNPKTRDRDPDSMPDVRKQAGEFAMSMNPANLNEMVEYYQYYLANFNKLVVGEIEAYRAKREQEIQAEAVRTGKDLNNKDKAKIEKALSLQVFGESFEGVKDRLISEAKKKIISTLSDPARGSGSVNAAALSSLRSSFDASRLDWKDKLGSSQINPDLPEAEAANAIRRIKDISFGSETAAVYHVEKHYHELPKSLRTANQPATEYLAAARKAVQEAQQVTSGYSPAEPGVRNFAFILTFQDPISNEKHQMRAIVKVLPGGKTFFATLIISSDKKK